MGHSVLDNVQKLAIRDPSLAEDVDLSQLRILWLVRHGLNWGKLRRFVVPELQSLLPDIIYIQVHTNLVLVTQQAPLTMSSGLGSRRYHCHQEAIL